MKTNRLSIGLLILTALLCGFPSLLPAAALKRIVIGHPEALSGQYAKAGEQAIGGIQAAVEWVNTVHGGVRIEGRQIPLDYKFYDCESRKESVTSLLERLITSDKVHFTMAPYSSGLTLAGAPVTEKYGMIYLNHGGASDKIFEQGFEYIVQTIGPGSQYHAGTLEMIRHLDPKAKRLALAYEDSEFARSVMDGAEAKAKQLGFQIVFKRTYPQAVADLTPLLSDLKASNPEIVLGGGHFQDGQLLNKQLADLKINVKLLSLIAAATLPAFGNALGPLAEGVMGPSHWEYGVTFSPEAAQKNELPWIGPEQDEFVNLFKKATGQELIPDYHAAEAAAAVLALVAAVEKAGSVDSDLVRKAFGELEFMSFYGTWKIDATGKQVGHDMVDVQWQQGERKIVWPLATKTADVVYPKPRFK
ncbi:MAG: amino acid ABC transporter substrate-binding protein [Deltaproteobacteria bacterium]|nr:amino acid ABC transporter substrate-binding protein [Deltaproteobacteria bacterium]